VIKLIEKPEKIQNCQSCFRETKLINGINIGLKDSTNTSTFYLCVLCQSDLTELILKKQKEINHERI